LSEIDDYLPDEDEDYFSSKSM